MNTSRLVLQLAQAARRRDLWGVTNAIQALVEHEEKKKSGGIAEQLRRLLPHAGNDPRNQVAALKYLDEVTPRVRLDDLQLHDDVREACTELLIEQRRAAVLASAGPQPRNRVLLTGPPDNGKTSVAEAIAAALDRPFYVISYDTLIGSHLGETGGRLRQVADYIGSHECVALFDEFEAVGKERDDGDEVGEIKRIVASLLIHLERMPPSTVILAATNHPGMFDRATWRRFQIRLELGAPDRVALSRYLMSRQPEIPGNRSREPPRECILKKPATQTRPSSATTWTVDACCSLTRTRTGCSGTDTSDGWRDRATTRNVMATNTRIRMQSSDKTSSREEPITAKELLRTADDRLSRYRNMPDTLTTVTGHLEDARTVWGNEAALVILRPVDGLNHHHMVTATIRKPTPDIDEVLEKIGPGGRITLVGMARPTRGAKPDIEMSTVHTINNVPTTPPKRGTHRPTPPRRWWQWWRQDAPEHHAER